MAALVACIPAVLGLVAALFQLWQAKEPQREKEKADETTQMGRQDIADGNESAIDRRIDADIAGVPSVTCYSPPGQYDPGSLLQRVKQATGADILPDRAGGTDETP